MTVEQDLRYPIGRFAPSPDSPSTRATHIQAIRDLPQQLRDAVAGLTDPQLDTPYRDGGWTVRQVVHHLGDSHANSFVRFKLALTEEWPTIKAYDEAAWARLPDSSIPIAGSLTFLDALHARWVALLEAMSEDDFARGFVHPENGRQTLAKALAIYSWHGHHHTAHITGLRKRQGW